MCPYMSLYVSLYVSFLGFEDLTTQLYMCQGDDRTLQACSPPSPTPSPPDPIPAGTHARSTLHRLAGACRMLPMASVGPRAQGQ